MFAGIQKAVYPGLASFVLSLATMALTGEGGPTDDQISAFALTITELLGAGIVGVLTAAVAWTKKNINVNGIVMSFVDRQGNVQDASGRVVGNVESGGTTR